MHGWARLTAADKKMTPGGSGQDGGDSLDEVKSGMGVGRTKYDLEMVVHPEVGDPYVVTARTKMSNRLGGMRNFFKKVELQPGLDVPVTIDDRKPDRVSIDWEAFADEGGVDHLVLLCEQRRHGGHNTALAKAALARPPLPTTVPMAAARERVVAEDMVAHVLAGRVTSDELDRWLGARRDVGLLDDAEVGVLRGRAATG